MNRYTIVY